MKITNTALTQYVRSAKVYNYRHTVIIVTLKQTRKQAGTFRYNDEGGCPLQSVDYTTAAIDETADLAIQPDQRAAV